MMSIVWSQIEQLPTSGTPARVIAESKYGKHNLLVTLHPLIQFSYLFHKYEVFIGNDISLENSENLSQTSVYKDLLAPCYLTVSGRGKSCSAGQHTVPSVERLFCLLCRESTKSKLTDTKAIRTFMMPPVISTPSKGKWHPDSMKQAVENVLTGQLSILKAAEIYNIPRSTLIDRVSAVKGDGHISHKDLEVITYARNQNIHMLSTPPHKTHKLQPLDRVFMKPFKDAYYEACGLWMRNNPVARITEYEIASLVGDAFARVSRAEIAVKGFQCTGIHPLNPNVCTELDYLPSMMTDIAMDSNVDQTESPTVRPMLPFPGMTSAP
ncbi:hypothetical protein ANN_22607 [Periplaneta americana]|uniref:HTH psq-type domain-containing protein n=1 Tax=Periplaneta americana TaxID=6978 RepID=A0ABQ8S8N2_PERAM|nr:hypothetical protein ANN_22607 [Periplaneta americana]